MGSRCKRSTLAVARTLAARCSSYATPTADVLVLGYLMDYERAMGRISVRANRELCRRRPPIWADLDPGSCGRQVAMKYECSTGQGRMTTLRCASQSRSRVVEGAIPSYSFRPLSHSHP